MANLSITGAWNETMAFMKRESGLVLPIAFLLIALPGALLQIVMPQPAAPGAPPELGLWLLLLPVVAVAGMVAYLAISYLALRAGTSVGEALQVGLRRFLMLFLATLLVGCGFVLLLIPLLFIVGGGAALGGGGPGALAGAAVLAILIFAVVALAIGVRLMLMTPVAAVEKAGPIEIIRRSWILTSGHFWKLLGLLLLLLVAALVLVMVVALVAGIILFMLAGPPDPQSLSMILITIVTALLQAVLSAIFTVLVARIYAQLSGDTTESVFA
jgi:hypothetical protein